MEEKRKEHFRRQKIISVILMLAGAAVLLTGVFFFLQGQTASEPKRVIFIPKIIDMENDFWIQLIEGAEMAALEYGLDIEVVAASQEIAFEEQNELIAWAIEQQPDAIVLAPSSHTESAASVEAILEHQIPLILVDSEVAVEQPITRVATDNVEAGRIQGEYMTQFLDETSEIALVCHVQGSSTALDREEGVRQGLGEYADQIVEVVFCDSDYEKAYELMLEILERHPKLTMVAGLNEYSAVGAARAVVDKGAQDQVKMIGFDSSLEEIRLLEQGIFEGIVIQNPYKMGYLAVEAAQRQMLGGKQEDFINSGAKLITGEELFTEENQKILFLFTEE